MSELQAIVHGNVQGVAYRAYVQDVATNLGLCGTVENVSDGTVQVVAQGAPDVLKEFVEHLHEGSVLSEVAGVSVEWESGGETFEDFGVLH